MAEAATSTSLIVRDCRVVYKGEEPALFPGIARAANGDLLLAFCTRFDCLPGGEAYLLRSIDGGRTWTGPRLMARSAWADGGINLSVGLTALANGTLLYPCCDARITRRWDQHEVTLLMLRSTDHGAAWTLATIPADVREPFAYGRPVELPGGDVLWPVWGKAREDEAWRSGLLRSRDGGATWGEHVTIAFDPDASIRRGGDDEIHCAGFNETSIASLGDGRLIAVLRQQGVDGGRRELYRAYSHDGGRTWSCPKRLPLWGTSPSLHRTSDGTLLLGYRNHLGNPQRLTAPGVGVSLSRDGGATWDSHMLLPDPAGHQYGHEFEAGYPAFLDLSNDRVLAVYYTYGPCLRAERYLASAEIELLR
jgi:BNR repeat-like domain